MDNGISIPVSLKNSGHVYKDDCDAIIKAVNGLSAIHGNEFIGRGTGLNTVIDIITNGVNGNILIASGQGAIEITASSFHTRYLSKNYLKGTLIAMKLKSHSKVNIYNHMKGIRIGGIK